MPQKSKVQLAPPTKYIYVIQDDRTDSEIGYKYNNFFINNHYGYIISGNLNIVNNESFGNSYPKAQSIENKNKFDLKKLVKKYKLVLINSSR